MLPFSHIYSGKNNKLGAFTLVELLIAVSIFSVVSIAIYSTFNSASAILQRVKNIDLIQQKGLFKIERFSRELREQAVYKKKLFSGTKTSIRFPANVDYFPCRISYYYDNSSLCLMRVVDKLNEIITSEGKIDPELKSKPQVFLSKAQEVKFAYLYLDLKKNVYGWIDEWQQDYLPVAVKLTVNIQNQEYASTIFL